MQRILEVQQALSLVLGQLSNRNTGPAGDNGGNIVLGDSTVRLGLLVSPLLLAGLHRFTLGLLLVTQLGGVLKVLTLDGLFLLCSNGGNFVLELLQIRRSGQAGQANAGAGLINYVDCLIRQVTAGDIADRQLDSGFDGLIRNLDAVVRLVLVAQTLQNLNGILGRRLVDLNRLETTLQSGILLNILAVLVKRGCTDDLYFAAAQCRLEDVRCIGSALSGTGAHQHMHLINEQDGVLLGGQLFNDLLDALLELAAVLGARDHAGQVERDQALALQGLRYVAGNNLLGQTLDNGGLADTRITDQRRVVLGAAGQNLDDTLNLLGAADNRVQLALLGSGCQVAAKLAERVLAVRAAGSRCAGLAGNAVLYAAERFIQLLDKDLRGDFQVSKRGQCHILPFAQDAEQQMFGADIAGAHLIRGLYGQLYNALGARRHALRRGGIRGAAAGQLLDLMNESFVGHACGSECLCGRAAALTQQAEQQVLRANVAVAERSGRFLCKRQCLTGTLGKTVLIEHK